MIFVTVGSRSFQFDRLLKAIDDAVSDGDISDSIFAQVGSSEYTPQHYEWVRFLNQDQFNKKISECDIVITHGGTGVIVNSVKHGKKVIAVPRLKRYGEVVDDHQIQLVREFEKMGMITACHDCEKISDAIISSKTKDIVSYKSNTNLIIQSIEDFLKGV